MSNTIQTHKLSSSEAKVLKGKHDILTFEEFEAGMSIVVCKDCNTPHLESTWREHPHGAQCYACGCKDSGTFAVKAFAPQKVRIKTKTVKIRASTKGIKKKIEDALLLLKEFNLLDSLLNLSQAVGVFRIIAIIFLIIAGSATAIFYSQSKFPADDIKEKLTITTDYLSTKNDHMTDATEALHEGISTRNSGLINSSKQFLMYTKTSIDYSKRKSDGVNYQIGIMIKPIIEWIEDL